MKNRRNWWAALLTVGTVVAVGLAMLSSTGVDPTTQAEEATEPSRERVQRQAMRAATWRFVYCLEDAAGGEELVALLHEIAQAQPFGKRIEVISCQNISADSLAAGPLTIFGDQLPEHPDPALLERDDGNAWVLDDRLTIAGDDVLYLPYTRNPWSEEPTVTGYYLSTNLDQLVKLFRRDYSSEWSRMFWPNWAYELYRENGDRVYGSFDDESWGFAVDEEITMASPEVPVYDQDGLTVYAYDGQVKTEELDRSVAGLRLLRSILDSLTGKPMDWYPEVRLYPNLERIGLRQGSMNPVQYTATEQILHLVPGFLSDTSLLLSFEVWQPFVEKLAKDTLTGSNRQYLIAALQRNADYAKYPVFRNASIHALRVWKAGVVSGSVDFQVEDGSSFLEEASARVSAVGTYLRNPEEVWKMIEKYEGQPPLVRKYGEYNVPGFDLREVAKRPPTDQPLAGMTFAHQGYRVHNGYGGEKIKPSLDSLLNLHVNALAIVPYSFMRDPNKPTRLPIPERAGSENDWATTCAIREAKNRGMFVLLKPQIWLGGGHWPGDIDFTTEKEWATFFDNYTYWILHYALLAEREQVNALCLGTELVQTTLKHPDRWREIIRKVRMVYGGQLTYAANWGEEFEGFIFWEELDAIGLNSYYPLSDKEQPTDEELLEGARSWLIMAGNVSKKFNRPLWLTETGFRSTDRAWQNPHADAGDRPENDEAQLRCFHALLTAASETPELRGIFIWKWPSFLGKKDRRNPGTSFTPGGKPAAQRLENHYKDWVR